MQITTQMTIAVLDCFQAMIDHKEELILQSYNLNTQIAQNIQNAISDSNFIIISRNPNLWLGFMDIQSFYINITSNLTNAFSQIPNPTELQAQEHALALTANSQASCMAQTAYLESHGHVFDQQSRERIFASEFQMARVNEIMNRYRALAQDAFHIREAKTNLVNNLGNN